MFLEWGEVFSHSHNLVVEFFGNTRYHVENMRLYILYVAHDGAKAFGVVNRYALYLESVVHHTFVNMAQRQETNSTLLVFGRDNRTNTVRVRQDVLVRKHYALWVACCSRGVYEREYIVLVDFLFAFLDNLHQFIFLAFGVYHQRCPVVGVGNIGKCVYARLILKVFDDLFCFCKKFSIRHEYHLCFAVAHNELEFGIVESRVNWHVNKSCHRNSHVEDIPVWQILRNAYYLVALLQTGVDKCACAHV